jgi:hypothetical protein
VGKIVEERDKFRDLLVNWWSRGASAMSREDAEIAADATINKIVGAKIPRILRTFLPLKFLEAHGSVL